MGKKQELKEINRQMEQLAKDDPRYNFKLKKLTFKMEGKIYSSAITKFRIIGINEENKQAPFILKRQAGNNNPDYIGSCIEYIRAAAKTNLDQNNPFNY